MLVREVARARLVGEEDGDVVAVESGALQIDDDALRLMLGFAEQNTACDMVTLLVGWCSLVAFDLELVVDALHAAGLLREARDGGLFFGALDGTAQRHHAVSGDDLDVLGVGGEGSLSATTAFRICCVMVRSASLSP